MIVKHGDIFGVVSGDEELQIGIVIISVVRTVFGLTFVREPWCLYANMMTYGSKVGGEAFVVSDAVDNLPAFQVADVLPLPLLGNIQQEIVGPVGVELALEEAAEVRDIRHELRVLALEVVVGADLQVPRVAHHGELEQ